MTLQSPAVALLGEGGISAKSSYVFHPQLVKQLREHFDSDTWIAIPARDTLIVFSKSANERRQLLEMVAEDFKSTDNALSDRLFEPTPDGVVLG